MSKIYRAERKQHCIDFEEKTALFSRQIKRVPDATLPGVFDNHTGFFLEILGAVVDLLGG